MIIGIDIDDTLTIIKEAKISTAQKYIKRNNLPYKLIDENTHLLSKMFDWSQEESNKFWFEEYETILKNATLRENVVQVIKNLKSQGHKIIIISARTTEWHKDPYKESYDWLMEKEIAFDKLIVGSNDKTQSCLEENVDVFIDDMPNHLIKLQNLGIRTILMSASHNLAQTEYKGEVASSWGEIERLLK